jgi:hypothetical protein
MQELVTIPTPAGELTLLASEIRALRKNQRKSPKQRADTSDQDYGLAIILFDPLPGPEGEADTAQLWFIDPGPRDKLYDELREAMAKASPTEE